MKVITREVKMYNYKFAEIDCETGTASNMTDVETPVPMGQRQIRDYCKSHENTVLIRTDEYSRKFSLPLTEFIKSCEDYAERVNNNEAAPITDSDSEDIDAVDYEE